MGILPMTSNLTKGNPHDVKKAETMTPEVMQNRLIRRFDQNREIPLIAWIYQTRDVLTGQPGAYYSTIENRNEPEAQFRTRLMNLVRYGEASEYWIARQVTIGLGEEIQLLKYQYRSPMFEAWVAPIRGGRLRPFEKADLSQVYREPFSVPSEKSA